MTKIFGEALNFPLNKITKDHNTKYIYEYQLLLADAKWHSPVELGDMPTLYTEVL